MSVNRTPNNDKNDSFNYFDNTRIFYETMEALFALTPDSFSGKQSRLQRTPRKDFVGSSNVEELNGEIKSFLYQDILSKFIKNAEDIIGRINLGGSFDKSKIVATSQPIGVFDFSLASKGLYAPQEYYCPELEKLISDKDAVKVSSNPNKFFYYHKKENGEVEAMELVQQQKGTFKMLAKEGLVGALMNSGYSEKKAKEEASKVYKNAKLKFATTIKKVYLTRKNKSISDKKGSEKYVDLYVIVGATQEYTPISILYKTLPSLMASYFLNKAGIKSRIIGVLALKTEARNVLRRSFNTFVVKDYNDSFDFNKISITLADPRVFRWKMFRGIVGFYNIYDIANKGKGFDIGGDLGTIIGINGNSKELEVYFEKYKNWYLQTFPNSFNKNRRLMITSAISFTQSQIKDSTGELMKNKAIEEFYSIINAIDIEFNDANTAIAKILERDSKAGTDSKTIRSRINSAIERNTIYDDSDSKYANTDKYIEEQISRRFKMLMELNSVISLKE